MWLYSEIVRQSMTNEEKLIEAFVQGLSVKPNEVNDGLKFHEHDKWDSVGHMMLVEQMESAFGISLEITQILAMSSYAKVKEILHNDFNIEF